MFEVIGRGILVTNPSSSNTPVKLTDVQGRVDNNHIRGLNPSLNPQNSDRGIVSHTRTFSDAIHLHAAKPAMLSGLKVFSETIKIALVALVGISSKITP
jgi:hypothetical protein